MGRLGRAKDEFLRKAEDQARAEHIARSNPEFRIKWHVIGYAIGILVVLLLMLWMTLHR